MRTAREIWLLSRDAVRLWWRFGATLGFWFCVGFVIRELGLFASTWLSGQRIIAGVAEGSPSFWAYRAAETLVFIGGMVGWVICLVLMIASTRTGLPAVAGGRLPDAITGGIGPASRRRELLFDSVPAFLAVFAVGGFAEEQVDALFQVNMITWRSQFANFSVSLADWRGYLALTGLAAVLALAARALLRGRRSLPGALLRLTLKAVTVLAGFLALAGLVRDGGALLRSRRVWQWGRSVWESFLSTLPDWTLWPGLTMPEAVREAARFFWSSALPALVDSAALPLLWLALTATAFGWYDFRHGVTASNREQVLLDASRKLVRGKPGAGPLQVTRLWLINQAEDYLPTLQAVRFVLRAGVRFAVAFLVVMAVLSAAEVWLQHFAERLVGPLTLRELAFASSFFELLELPIRTLWVAVLAVAFDRAVQVIAAPANMDPIGVDLLKSPDQGSMMTAHGGS